MRLTKKKKKQVVTQVLVNKEKSKVLDQVLEGNLSRFLRRHKKNYWYETTYLFEIPRWKKNKKGRIAIKWLFKREHWPSHIKSITNIARTLISHYGYKRDILAIKAAYQVWEYFDDTDIYPYMYKLYVSKYSKDLSKIYLKKKRAFKEQKARGFVHVNDFEDYVRGTAHVQSLVNRNYIYPANFTHGIYGREVSEINIYIGNSLVGVPGFNRCDIPK